MKIIQVIPFFGMGGAETMCENLIYELRNLGHTVIAVSLFDKQTVITKRLSEANVDIRYLGKKDGLDISMFGKLKKIFKEEKPDVVHTHLYTAKYVFPVASRMKIKVVHTVHNIAQKEASKLSRAINKLYFKNKKVIPVALSNQIQKTIVEEYGLPQKEVPIALNGIDLKKCIPKNKYEIGNSFVILHIGRFFLQKNHEGLIRAFHQFHERHSDSELWLIGDGEKRSEIEEYVRNNGLKSCVKFYGMQGNVYDYLHSADIFALPSLYEGVPMTIAEAMGTGLPIVATAVGGIPDMLDESDALLVPADANAIAEAFEKYYMSIQLRSTHGTSALRNSVKFSSVGMAEEYEIIYRKAKSKC